MRERKLVGELTRARARLEVFISWAPCGGRWVVRVAGATLLLSEAGSVGALGGEVTAVCVVSVWGYRAFLSSCSGIRLAESSKNYAFELDRVDNSGKLALSREAYELPVFVCESPCSSEVSVMAVSSPPLRLQSVFLWYIRCVPQLHLWRRGGRWSQGSFDSPRERLR